MWQPQSSPDLHNKARNARPRAWEGICQAKGFPCRLSCALVARLNLLSRTRKQVTHYSAGAPALLAIARLRFFANRLLRRFTRAFWYAAISGAERK